MFNVAYHLAKFGWKDTILLERDQLTSGTTWHAAGLVSQLGPSAAITKIRKYTTDLYKELEKKTGFSAGLKLNGALSIATTKGRWQELQRQATTAQLFDVHVEVLNIEQVKKIYPIINDKRHTRWNFYARRWPSRSYRELQLYWQKLQKKKVLKYLKKVQLKKF